MTTDFNETARRLRNAMEPVAAGVYFAPEAHAAYQALRLGGSPITQDGVARPEMTTYFLSPSACMGQVPGEVVAASAFGCFNPKTVVPAVAAGWQITNRERILAARERVAIAMLERILGDQPKRLDRATELLRQIYGGLRSHRSPHAWARLSEHGPPQRQAGSEVHRLRMIANRAGSTRAGDRVIFAEPADEDRHKVTLTGAELRLQS